MPHKRKLIMNRRKKKKRNKKMQMRSKSNEQSVQEEIKVTCNEGKAKCFFDLIYKIDWGAFL